MSQAAFPVQQQVAIRQHTDSTRMQHNPNRDAIALGTGRPRPSG